MNDLKISGRVLVDTNVLIYATLEKDTRHIRAREVLSWRNREDIEFFVSVQNLAEMYPNLTGPKNSPSDSPELARRKIESISSLNGVTVLSVDHATQRMALKLCEHYQIRRQNYFDAQLVATMLGEEIEIILTENDRDFTEIKEVRAVNPFADKQ